MDLVPFVCTNKKTTGLGLVSGRAHGPRGGSGFLNHGVWVRKSSMGKYHYGYL